MGEVTPKPTIIFDVGNVILPFDPLRLCRVLAQHADRTAEEVYELIYKSDLERRFEEGKIDGRQFTDGVAEVLGVSLEYDWFRNLWSDMFTENSEFESRQPRFLFRPRRKEGLFYWGSSIT